MTLHEAISQKHSLCIEEKKLWLMKFFNKSRVPFVDDRDVIVVNRENLVQESFDAFSTMADLNLHKELQVYFVGEKA